MSAPVHPALRPVRRWVASRKEAVARAVLRAEITVADALEAHDLSRDELVGWLVGHRLHGRAGLYALAPHKRRASPLLLA